MKYFFKHIKEELVAIPVLLLLVELLRFFIAKHFPHAALFDAPSELETFLVKFWQFIWITCSVWMLLRIVFPKIYKYLINEFYENFDRQTKEFKLNVSIKLFITFLLAFVLLFSGRGQTNEVFLRTNLVDTLYKQLQVRELTNNNDGVAVESYLKSVGFNKGYAWCAAFCSYNFQQYSIPNPQSAYSPNFAKAADIIWIPKMPRKTNTPEPQAGDCFTLYYNNLGRVGHVGFIVGKRGNYFITIEGNTGTTGSREGDGVHSYKRACNKVYAVSNYIKNYKGFKTNLKPI